MKQICSLHMYIFNISKDGKDLETAEKVTVAFFNLNMQSSFKYFYAPFHNLYILNRFTKIRFLSLSFFLQNRKRRPYKIHVYFDSYWLISVK